MAPRRRPKVGSSRMDAALDAMRTLGFSAPVVRKCVKNLLKVYGNDGWVVIEESAYTLLIDTLLEESVVEQLEHEPPKLLLEGGSQSQATDHGKQPEPVQQLIVIDKNVIVDDREVIKTHGDDIIEVKREEESEEQVLEGGSQSQATDHGKQPEPVQQLISSDKNVIVEDKEVSKTRGDDIIKVKLEEESEGHVLEGGSQATDHEKQLKLLQQMIESDKNVIVEGKKVIKTRGDDIIKVKREDESEEQGSYVNVMPMLLLDDKAQPGFDLACTPESSDIINSKKRKRKPCFGWIGDDEDEDSEFLQLTPAKSVESCCMKKNS